MILRIKFFLQIKEWTINNIKLWHFLYVSLSYNLLQITIRFYEGLDQILYETQFIINQFYEVYIKLQFGNILQSSTNYLSGILKNMKFSNSASEGDIFNGCNHSCKQCEGPTNQDCLSCSEESKRIYIPQFKVCFCPFDYIDDLERKSMENYNLLLDPEFEYNSISNCPQGYFNKDEFCLKCPSFLKDTLMTCLEFIQNPKGWQNDPYCYTNLFIDTLGSPAQYKIDNLKTYYIFDGIDIKPLQQVQIWIRINLIQYTQLLKRQIRVFQDFSLLQTHIQLVILVLLNNVKFIQCQLQNKFAKNIKKWKMCRNTSWGHQQKQLLIFYYKTSENICNLCEIENCQFCFEYVSNDLTKCTLYSEFQLFQKDEFLKIGCALCLDGFIFDFTLSNCFYKESPLPNCLSYFINPLGQQLYTLSAIQDFGVPPEITNCQRYISNCKQCIQTPYSIVKFIICEDGYSSSLITGHCTICEEEYAKMYAWMQQI
ncbi:unnamed protein product [Paramecium pentaurelia]|uniref:Uncharacterized protein n=1 Tax=Paramecium pentaurelia TaxID=43138 RepID=A0A8S1X975_9CILI|nr:unnamed protein product [Paramecium pentaurelia]